MNFTKLKQFINYKTDLDKIHRSNDDIYALQIIYKLFPEFSYLPFTPFSLNPYTIVHVLNDILLNDRKQIIEFGSGLSTLIIAQFIKSNNLKTKILSIDSNRDWQLTIEKEVKKHNATDNLTFVYAELKEHNLAEYEFKNNKIWYNNNIVKEALDELDHIDLIIVDGPSTSTSNYARYPSFSSVESKLANSYCIFLDDTRRPAEREIIEKWNNSIKGNLQFEKMYATIAVESKFSTKPLSH